jgi:uncharacterized protein
MGERDLMRLLRSMEPFLHEAPYGYASSQAVPPGLQPFATVAEAEGMTIVADHAALLRAGLASDPWARISLTVHSDLTVVCLTAASATTLAREGISANVVAGYFHDHLFVQWERREDAMAALRRLSDA